VTSSVQGQGLVRSTTVPEALRSMARKLETWRESVDVHAGYEVLGLQWDTLKVAVQAQDDYVTLGWTIDVKVRVK